MFGRFRKTNEPERETDGGAVAVDERERAGEEATSVATPSADPAARERRLAELQEPPAADPGTRATATSDTRTADPETRAAERDRVAEPETKVAERDRFARTERVAADEPAWVREDEPRTIAPVIGEETVVAMRARQRDRFGGIRWGSAFFGLLSAIGLAALLLGIVAAAGVAIGVSEIENVTNGDTDTIGLGGAILVLAALALSWYCGGYVAGRMARFDGARQGIGVWAWTLVIGAALAIAAVIGGSEYDVLQQLNLPNVAVGDESLTTTGLVTLAAALVVTLLFAILGGKAGEIFHRRVDRFAAREYVETP
jgi:hypothetical protein